MIIAISITDIPFNNMPVLDKVMKKNNKMTVKSVAEKKSWFGRIKNVFYGENETHDPVAKRSYNKTSNEQIRKMLRLRKDNPKLSHPEIAKLVDVTEEVADYWLDQKESTVIANLKARKGRKVAQKKRKERIQTKKPTKSVVVEQPQTPSNEVPEMTVEDQLTLRNFITISNNEGEKIIKQIRKENKHPLQELASPKWKGTVPDQAVATEEEWKKEDRDYKIGKAVMHKSIVTKQEADTQSKKEEQTKAKSKIMHEKGLRLDGKPLKLHIPDKCPSCNPNSKLTLKEYQTIVFHVFNEMKDYAVENNKVKKQQDQRAKQLDQRANQLVELEKESIGNVADRVKEGTKICLVCNSPITHPQVSRCRGRYGVGQWYCADHEPELPSDKEKKKK